MDNKQPITIQTNINAPLEKVWELYTNPDHVIKWNNASDDWHTPNAENDLREGGSFKYRMEAKDGSAGFDFEGVYDQIVPMALIKYHLLDGRKVEVVFSEDTSGTMVVVNFEPEDTNSLEMQRSGWQSILDNFKGYVEG